MTATFKVAEFYRNNNNNNNNNNITNALNNLISSELINFQTTNLNVNKIPVHLIPSFNLIYSTLGFNVLGGYLTDIPATIIDVALNANGKLPVKV